MHARHPTRTYDATADPAGQDISEGLRALHFDIYIIRSGIMTRIGVIAVLVMMAVDSIVRWKRGQDAS